MMSAYSPRRILHKIRFPDYDPRGINCAITRNGKRATPLSNSDVLVASPTSLRKTARAEKRNLLLPPDDDSRSFI